MEGRMIPSKGAYNFVCSLVPSPSPAFRHLQYGKAVCAWGEPGNDANLFAHFILIGNITPNTRMEGGEPGGHTLPISDSLYGKIILLLSLNDITHSSI